VTVPNAPYAGAVITMSAPLPAELQAEIDKSVQEFSARLGVLRAWAQAGEWIEQYRAEVTRLVRAALIYKS
jgi:hypothetical protein